MVKLRSNKKLGLTFFNLNNIKAKNVCRAIFEYNDTLTARQRELKRIVIELMVLGVRNGMYVNINKMDILDQIKGFVTKQRWEYDFNLTRETELRKDLKLGGDDAVEFMIAFGKEFNVDISSLDLNKYFPPEGDRILPAIIHFFSLKKAPKYFSLTLGDLETAVKNGKLD